jgi:hypothetical protein
METPGGRGRRNTVRRSSRRRALRSSFAFPLPGFPSQGLASTVRRGWGRVRVPGKDLLEDGHVPAWTSIGVVTGTGDVDDTPRGIAAPIFEETARIIDALIQTALAG